jgi:crotonobetainyl-CoA:carnitine CoA-transferase CaiB-like acyl-CoA transferase
MPERHRTGSNRVVPFEAFETSTGPIIIAAGNDRLFAKLAKVVGHPEWATDARYAINGARVSHKDELIDAIAAIIATRTKGEWIDALEAEGVPCGVINALPDAVAHPQAKALGIVQPVPGDDELSLIALPLSFDGVRPAIRRAPPAKIGEHDHEVRAAKGRWPARS